jgi:hypothetical protein
VVVGLVAAGRRRLLTMSAISATASTAATAHGSPGATAPAAA